MIHLRLNEHKNYEENTCARVNKHNLSGSIHSCSSKMHIMEYLLTPQACEIKSAILQKAKLIGLDINLNLGDRCCELCVKYSVNWH